MTTSREQFLIEIVDVFGGSSIPEETRLFFRERLRRRLHDLVLNEFVQLEAKSFTRAQLGRRIGKSPAQITRYLGGPGNWTLDTVSDLLLAMGGEPSLEAMDRFESRTQSKAPKAVTVVRASVEAVSPAWVFNAAQSTGLFVITERHPLMWRNTAGTVDVAGPLSMPELHGRTTGSRHPRGVEPVENPRLLQ